MNRQRTLALASLLVLSLALPALMSATAVTGEPKPGASALPGAQANPTLRIANDYPKAVNVILFDKDAEHDADEYLLGTVPGKAARVFDVPTQWVGERNVAVIVTPIFDDKDFDRVADEFRAGPILLSQTGSTDVWVDQYMTLS